MSGCNRAPRCCSATGLGASLQCCSTRSVSGQQLAVSLVGLQIRASLYVPADYAWPPRVCAAMACLQGRVAGAWCDVPFEKAGAVGRGLLFWFMWPGAGQPSERQRTLVSAFFAVLVTPRCEAITRSSFAFRRPCLRPRRGPPPPCAATLTTGPRISTPADDDSSRDGGREGGGRVGRSKRQQRQQLLSGKVRRLGTPWLWRSASSCLCAVLPPCRQ